MSAEIPAVRYRWRQVALGGGGYVTGLVIHPRVPDLVYLRTDVGGAYRLDTAASRWIPLLDGFGRGSWHQYGVESLAVDPSNPEVVYAALGKYLPRPWLALRSAVYRSGDRGRTWTATGLSVAMGGNEDWRWAGERLAVDPNLGSIVYFGSRSDGLFRSEDSGARWQRVDKFPTMGAAERGLVFVVIDPASGHPGERSGTLYVGAAGAGVYESRDGGATWRALPQVGLPDNPQRAALAADGTLYVSLLGDGKRPGGVVRYRGGKGVAVTPPGRWDYCGVATDPRDPQVVMVAPISDDFPTPLFRSTDAGAHWTSLRYRRQPDVPWWPARFFTGHTASLVIDPLRPRRVFYTDYYGVWRTDDISQTPSLWRTHQRGHEETEAFVLRSPPAGPPLISGVADVDGFRHDDLEEFPRQRLNGAQAGDGDTTGLDHCPADPAVLYRVGDERPGPYRGAVSRDGGATWARLPALPFREARRGRVAVSATACDHLVWLPEGAPPYRSRDGGATWTVGVGAPAGAIDDRWNYSHPLASDRVDGDLVYLYLAGLFHVSSDGGAAWRRGATIAAPPYDRRTGVPGPSVKATPGVRGEVWLCLSEGGLLRSRDAGQRFVRVPGVDLCQLFGFGTPLPGAAAPTLYVYGTVGGGHAAEGIFRSADLGASFQRIDDAAQPIGDQAMVLEGDGQVPGRLYIATNGRGIFYGEPERQATARPGVRQPDQEDHVEHAPDRPSLPIR